MAKTFTKVVKTRPDSLIKPNLLVEISTNSNAVYADGLTKARRTILKVNKIILSGLGNTIYEGIFVNEKVTIKSLSTRKRLKEIPNAMYSTIN